MGQTPSILHMTPGERTTTATVPEPVATLADDTPTQGIAWKRTKSRCAIMGFASSSRDLAPFNDPTWDIYILNELYNMVPRWDVAFEMHNINHIRSNRLRDGQPVNVNAHYEWLKAQPGPGQPGFRPIYMQAHYEDIPASIAFPLAALTSHFYPEGNCYFTSTPAYMMAIAIVAGYEEMGLYGIDLLQEEEYAYQRPCMEYLVGVARGMGKKVHVPTQSALMKANYVYGFTEPTDNAQLQPLRDFLGEQITKHQAQFNQAQVTMHTLNGVLQALNSTVSWVDHTGKRGGTFGVTPVPVVAPETPMVASS